MKPVDDGAVEIIAVMKEDDVGGVLSHRQTMRGGNGGESLS